MHAAVWQSCSAQYPGVSVSQVSLTHTHRTLTTGNHPQGKVTTHYNCQTPQTQKATTWSFRSRSVKIFQSCKFFLIFLWQLYIRLWGPVFGHDWQGCGKGDWPVIHWVVLRDPLCDYHCVHATMTTSTGDHI